MQNKMTEKIKTGLTLPELIKRVLIIVSCTIAVVLLVAIVAITGLYLKAKADMKSAIESGVDIEVSYTHDKPLDKSIEVMSDDEIYNAINSELRDSLTYYIDNDKYGDGHEIYSTMEMRETFNTIVKDIIEKENEGNDVYSIEEIKTFPEFAREYIATVRNVRDDKYVDTYEMLDRTISYYMQDVIVLAQAYGADETLNKEAQRIEDITSIKFDTDYENHAAFNFSKIPIIKSEELRDKMTSIDSAVNRITFAYTNYLKSLEKTQVQIGENDSVGFKVGNYNYSELDLVILSALFNKYDITVEYGATNSYSYGVLGSIGATSILDKEAYENRISGTVIDDYVKNLDTDSVDVCAKLYKSVITLQTIGSSSLFGSILVKDIDNSVNEAFINVLKKRADENIKKVNLSDNSANQNTDSEALITTVFKNMLASGDDNRTNYMEGLAYADSLGIVFNYMDITNIECAELDELKRGTTEYSETLNDTAYQFISIVEAMNSLNDKFEEYAKDTTDSKVTGEALQVNKALFTLMNAEALIPAHIEDVGIN